MASVQDLAAAESVKQQAAKARLAARVKKSEEQQNEVLAALMKHTIVDKLVPPSNLKFMITVDPKLVVTLGDGSGTYTVHRHALGQTADVAELTRSYLWKLYDSLPKTMWRYSLLAHNLDELFHKGDFTTKSGKGKRFLVRTVDKEIRGFLSQSYNRKLSTAPLLRTFIETCRQHGAGPVGVTATDVRVRVQYMLPYVFEPVDGEFVSFGVTFGNSDFGMGRLSVSGIVLRTGTESVSVVSDEYTKTHLGRMIKDEDLEEDWVSEETADKELEAFKSYVRDKVVSILGFESIERSIKAIQLAHEKQIPWYQLKEKLKDLLTKQETDMLQLLLTDQSGFTTTDLPPVQKAEDAEKATATAWWAANAVSMLAEKEQDPDRKSDLQNMAGKLITDAK